MSFNEWKEYKLGDLVDISSSKRIFAKEYCDQGIPFYRGKEIIEKFKGNDISTELFISEDRYKEIKEKFGTPIKGDILLSSVGTLGVPYLVDGHEFYFKDGNLTWLKNYKEFCYGEFIYYWIQSNYAINQIYSRAIGSTQKALTIDTLKKFDITLPPLNEQKGIVKILSDLDEKIEINNKINKKLEEMAQAIFKQWFVDFEFPNEDGKPYKSSWGEMVESELGMIPKGWEVVKLQDIGNLTMGLSPKSESYNAIGEGTPLLNGAADFYGGLIKATKYTTKETRVCKKNDLVFCIRATIGNITFADKEYCLGRGVASIESKKNLYVGIIYMNLSRSIERLKAQATGSVILGLSKPDINDMKLILPTKEILNKYSDIFKNAFDKKHILELENDKLINLRDTLLPKLMSGEIRVPVEN